MIAGKSNDPFALIDAAAILSQLLFDEPRLLVAANRYHRQEIRFTVGGRRLEPDDRPSGMITLLGDRIDPSVPPMSESDVPQELSLQQFGKWRPRPHVPRKPGALRGVGARPAVSC